MASSSGIMPKARRVEQDVIKMLRGETHGPPGQVMLVPQDSSWPIRVGTSSKGGSLKSSPTRARMLERVPPGQQPQIRTTTALMSVCWSIWRHDTINSYGVLITTPPTPPDPTAPDPSALRPSNGRSQQLVRLGHDLVLVGVQAVELDLEPVDGVDHRHRDHAGELPGGQLEAAGAGQLDGQDAEEEGGELLAQAGPDAAAERQVVEASLLVFPALLAEAVGVEGVHVLEDGRGVVGVADAVHHAPALRDLHSLEKRKTGGTETVSGIRNGEIERSLARSKLERLLPF
ncbi:hypothetical protein EYF80_026521 [Liparis tanakae]|uniref:Uncharacterized protein n=1 Tax=Liparis tanakae TaxID=230148 RepID=A0A4Z2HCN5_9TELE|nr:hypothetical protein EYF80_026521 [Liparis tanakae]